MVELQIEQFLLEKLEEPDYQDYFLLEVKYNKPSKKVEVFVDSDSGISLGVTSRLNRYLQERIDESGILGEKYILDVSSPGVGKPLKIPRQYKKNIGRTLEITYKEEDKSEKRKGTLESVNEEESIVITYNVKEKVGKKKIVKQFQKEIPFANIEKAVVKISFK